jgi:hypothetical protein
MAVTAPDIGLKIETGLLGVGESSPLLGPSPYLNLRESLESGPEAAADWRVRLTAGVIDVSANYLGALLPADPAAFALGAGIDALAKDAGFASPGAAAAFNYSDPYQRTAIVVTSALGQVGRAYTLGVIDAGWAATALVKTSSIFPNAAADATVGARARLSRRTLGVYAGTTGNVSPAGTDPLMDWFSSGSPFGVHMEPAPHASVSYRGPIADSSRLTLGLDEYRQWNARSTEDRLRLSLSGELDGRPAELGVSWRLERGPGIEYYRDVRRADVSWRLSEPVAALAAYEKDRLVFGNAELNHEAVILGVKIDLDGGRQSALVEARPTSSNAVSAPSIPEAAALSRSIRDAVTRALGAANAAGAAGDLDAAAAAIQAMTPAERDALEAALLSQPLSPQQRQWTTWFFSHTGQLGSLARDGASVLRLLTDDGLLEDFATRIARSQLIAQLNELSFEVPVLGGTLHWSPAQSLAAAQILDSRPSRVAPITAGDASGALAPWVLSHLAAQLGLPPNATLQQIASALGDHGPAPLRDKIRNGGAAALQAAASALSELLRRELNLMLAQALIASEQFDRLTVDGGRRPGQLSDEMLEKSYSALAERTDRVLARAARKLRAG